MLAYSEVIEKRIFKVGVLHDFEINLSNEPEKKKGIFPKLFKNKKRE